MTFLVDYNIVVCIGSDLGEKHESISINSYILIILIIKIISQVQGVRFDLFWVSKTF